MHITSRQASSYVTVLLATDALQFPHLVPFFIEGFFGDLFNSLPKISEVDEQLAGSELIIPSAQFGSILYLTQELLHGFSPSKLWQLNQNMVMG